MKRPGGLAIVSRRDFCGALAACAGLAVVGCTDGDGSSVVQTGGLGGTNGHGPDAGMRPIDGGVTQPDAMAAATCPSSGATDVGAASAFVQGTPKYFSNGNFFVMRDAGGLYALTARCTHAGVTCVNSSGHFYCPGHGATFSYNGDVLGGPVFKGLVHYEMCTLSNGNVGVVRSVTVSQSQRLVA